MSDAGSDAAGGTQLSGRPWLTDLAHRNLSLLLCKVGYSGTGPNL